MGWFSDDKLPKMGDCGLPHNYAPPKLNKWGYFEGLDHEGRRVEMSNGQCIGGRVNGPHGCNPRQDQLSAVALWKPSREKELEAENTRLKAELEKYKPKPVVSTSTHRVNIQDEYTMFDLVHIAGHAGDIHLTFHDGKLVKAEVKQPNGEWK